jgi:CRISPR-associated protein (TIGR02584 family)
MLRMPTAIASPLAPHEYARRVLLAVTGLSPQVVTETLYALAIAQRPAFVPTELHVITTANGAQGLRLALLSREPGWFERLRTDYALPPIAFDDAHIHVLRDDRGDPLDDIRSPEDNRLAADFITERVRGFTADADCALHVSMAGGRKTMGFFAGYALSLFGRPQDRLSHVLVTTPFEQSLQFFYPTPYSRVIEVRDRSMADTAQASLTLAEIPFVSLRHGLPKALLDGRAGFDETVQAAQRALAPAELVLDLRRQRIRASGLAIELPRALLALLALFARRALTSDAPLSAPTKGLHDPELAALYLRELRAIAGEMGDTDRTEARLAEGMDDEFFLQTRAKLHRRLETALGPAARPYLIDGGKTRVRRYRIGVGTEAICFGAIGD